MTNNILDNPGDILGFDIGSARIGVARIHTVVKISEPLKTIQTALQNPVEAIVDLISEHQPLALVFGLPRGLNGDDTFQTEESRRFVAQLRQEITDIPMYFIDEAGTSKSADEIISSTKSTASRDSVAACIILEDFINQKDTSLLYIENTLNNLDR